MESLHFNSVLHRIPKPSSLLLPQNPRPRPLQSLSFRPSTNLPIRASLSSSSTPPPRPPSLLKPACVTLAAAAAILAAALQKPSHHVSLAATAPQYEEATATPSSAEESKAPLTDDEKERILEEYLDQRPDDARSLRALMELKAKSGKYAEAVEVIDRLVLLDREDKDLPLLRAHLQSYAGDTESARVGFEELLQKNPLLVEAYHGLVMTAAQSDEGDAELEAIMRRVEAAIETCKKERRKEETRDFKLLVAQVRVMEGKYDEALRVYQELVREEPRDFRPYLCQGIVYSVLHKKDEAEKQFEKYRRLVPRGHPYARYFDDNVLAMKIFRQIDEKRRVSAMSR